MLNLNDLYFFVQVVERQGFTTASRALGVPKSTLSKRVAALEQQLGARLLHRTSRSFALTDVGREFHRHAAAALVEAEAAESAVKGRLAEPSGVVRLTASVPTVQLSLAQLLPVLAHSYPRIRVVVHATDRFVDVVQEGFDLAIRSHFAPLADSELQQRRLYTDPIGLIASPAYVERHGMPGRPEELAQHDGLLVSQAAEVWRLTDRSGEVVEVKPRPRYYADESTALIGAAQAGLGITALPRRFYRASVAAKTLVRVLPQWTAGNVLTTLLMPHRRGLLPAVRVVAEFLGQHLGSAE